MMPDSTTIVVFGASGDLTQCKLIPAFFNLFCKKRLPHDFRIVGFASTLWSDGEFRAALRLGVDKFAAHSFTEHEWSEFAARLFYRAGLAPGGSDRCRLAFSGWTAAGDL